jgi:hypothetical protein
VHRCFTFFTVKLKIAPRTLSGGAVLGELLDFISDHFSPAWGTAAAALATAYVLLVGLARLFEIWKSFRTRRAILEEEKLIAEIQKIRYEIEALRKHNDLPELALPGDAAGAKGHSRGWHALPELPSFSFTPAISLFALRWRRPGPGYPRVLWSLKLLAAVVAGFCIGMVIIVSLVPNSAQDKVVGPSFVFVVMLAAAYLISTCLLNLMRAWLTPRPKAAGQPG